MPKRRADSVSRGLASHNSWTCSCSRSRCKSKSSKARSLAASARFGSYCGLLHPRRSPPRQPQPTVRNMEQLSELDRVLKDMDESFARTRHIRAPDGEHVVTVSDIEFKTSKSGKPMLVWNF